MLSYRAQNSVALQGVWPIDPAEVSCFRQFFQAEVALHESNVQGHEFMFEEAVSKDLTLLRIIAKASSARNPDDESEWEAQAPLK